LNIPFLGNQLVNFRNIEFQKIIEKRTTKEVKKMSDMKHYEGTYSYTGTFKQLKDQSRLLEVTEFEYDGKYYRPSEILKFKITPQPEEGGWLSVTCEERKL